MARGEGTDFRLLRDDGGRGGSCRGPGHHHRRLPRPRDLGRRPYRPDETMNANLHLWLIPLLPFAGFLINGILGGRLPKWLVTTIALLAPLGAFGVVVWAVVSSIAPVELRSWNGPGPVPALFPLPWVETCPLPWINAGILHINFSFVLDQLSLVMLLVVTGVGFLIHVYSV